MHSVKSSHNPREAANLGSYIKLQTACAQLDESIKTIFKYALSSEDIEACRYGTPLEMAIAASPAVSIATYLNGLQSVADVSKVFQQFNFDDRSSPVKTLIEYPIVSDSNLESLAFTHRSCATSNSYLTDVEKTIKSNERLEFLGDSWLAAFVSYMLYERYPYANEGALSRMRDTIISNVNLTKWSAKLGFNERLKENLPRTFKQLKHKVSKHYADCVEAYIGALVVDRFSVEFKEIIEWIENLSREKLDELGSQMVKQPYNKNSKHELSTYLRYNKLGEELIYRRLNFTPPFRVEVRLGDILLATGEGANIKEAEQRAAMQALLDTSMIKQYSLFEIQDKCSEGVAVEDPAEIPENVRIFKPDEIKSALITPQSFNFVSYPISDDPIAEVMNDVSVMMENMAEKVVRETIRRCFPRKDNSHSAAAISMKNLDSATTLRLEERVKHNVPSPEVVKDIEPSPELVKDFDIMAKQTLYAILGRVHFLPEYVTEQKGIDEYMTICKIKKCNVILGEGFGNSKKISQRIAASNSLHGDSLQQFLQSGGHLSQNYEVSKG